MSEMSVTHVSAEEIFALERWGNEGNPLCGDLAEFVVDRFASFGEWGDSPAIRAANTETGGDRDLTDCGRLPPPLPPTTTALAGDEFDPESNERLLFLCWCCGSRGLALAADAKGPPGEIKGDASDSEVFAAVKDAEHRALLEQLWGGADPA